MLPLLLALLLGAVPVALPVTEEDVLRHAAYASEAANQDRSIGRYSRLRVISAFAALQTRCAAPEDVR